MFHVLGVAHVKGILICTGFVCVSTFKEKPWTSEQTCIKKVLERFFTLNCIHWFYLTAYLVSLRIQKDADEAESQEKGAVESR